MHYNAIVARLFKAHKIENRGLYSAIAIAVMLISPVILLFFPLLGYWILAMPVTDIRFWLGLGLLLAISKSMLSFHSAVVKVKYINWGIDCYGKHKFYTLYCVNRLIACTPVFILLAIGYAKAPLTPSSIISGITISLILAGFITLDSVWRLTSSTPATSFAYSFQLRFLLTPLLRLYLRWILFLFALSVQIYLMDSQQSFLFNLGIFTFIGMFTFTLLYTCSAYCFNYVESHRLFLMSLSARFYQSCWRNTRVVLFFIWAIAIALPWSRLLLF
ncbi:hypothetical protein [Alteromonas australica]|jgi:hypothetical protein|uniref:Uncharacterized protein n=1 Tax=Alteromonas australica TaxID=589873 RepID=A0A349TVP3_9ALTE|nr:hypothetical protein [Alteromonas australica]MAB94335.1 hypothetical protein [Alteromonas sp.]MAF69123.1 hypothetical protein [Alteromonas sp.]MBU34932.1 hypothetical protein [Alteromonas sp.]HAI72810.1 hypothetical protein [Alteromonas australica]HAU28108.1 hypothetical protein [Alteromonas australica]|tara:strand:+ start:5842 stop:6663 length:822 start_codon:yes stop_codon:yes gene_type:complete